MESESAVDTQSTPSTRPASPATVLTPTPTPTSLTPDQAPKRATNEAVATVSRVHSLPSKLVGSPNAFLTAGGGAAAPDAVETLFVHPEAKVVSFNILGSSVTRTGTNADGGRLADRKDPGTLAWVSPSERTLAAGQLRIYRVPSSGVSFLSSGPLLHPILKRSQCWLVDEQSKFVLRVREGQFYRIELPFASEMDKVFIEEFKRVLSTVLQYEKTPSPFRRGYVPEPSEPPKTPSRKSSKPREKAKKWRLNKVWEPEDPEHRAQWSPRNKEDDGNTSWQRHSQPRATTRSDESTSSSQETTEDEGSVTDESVVDDITEKRAIGKVSSAVAKLNASPDTYCPSALPLSLSVDGVSSVKAPAGFPPDTGTVVSMRSMLRSTSQTSDNGSIASSHDSFYSADEPTTASASGEANDESNNLMDTGHMSVVKASRNNHSRQISEITVTPGTPAQLTPAAVLNEDTRENSNPSTPTLISDSDEDHELPFTDAVTPPDTIRLVRIPDQSSDSASNEQALRTNRQLFTSQAPSRRRAISVALVQKVYSLLVGPPSHLVSLMLDIAARIMRNMQGARDLKRRIPGAWNSSHTEEEDEWDEDDFGIPLDNLRRESNTGDPLPGLRRTLSRPNSEASSDYDALIEGPMEASGKLGMRTPD
ncbi:uncharacterized protein PV09_09607 [Verruconis gallopava]|uniref:Inheritance of peroxisomes protein 1 n=1 Tax=Verruconis gallopava TaxID=253628 RepID=A0A0D1X949_9PEZI|nr:uncharacterized protein PV09_09607 [Verruconis gallopava]KIV98615.1 hypothetical protein PV09_09607 [Verruconis gallopava]